MVSRNKIPFIHFANLRLYNYDFKLSKYSVAFRHYQLTLNLNYKKLTQDGCQYRMEKPWMK